MPESYSTQLVPPAAEAAMTAAAEGAKNIDRLAPLLIVLWILLGISTITFALRFYAKRRTRKLSWDDSFMLVALAIAWLYTLFLDRAHHYGLGRHSKFLSDINFILCHKWITLSEGCGILAPTFGRMSFSVYLLGLIGYASIRLRWALIACIVSQFVTNGITTALVYLQCGTHVAAIWDPRVPANCLDPSLQNKWGYFHSGESLRSFGVRRVLNGV
ncbi:hypothetical protein H2203_008931 [Taxawa tesnikishii (nom. ined.)]|nr:hypothetical protein H2203_008931 [Dothideales sp. JES 119]